MTSRDWIFGRSGRSAIQDALTLTMILREEGHDVRAVHAGRNVMSAVIQENPDVVIIDIHMPDVSGWQVAQTVRARRQTNRLRPLTL